MLLQPFNPSGEPNTCLYCGRKLREVTLTTLRPLTPEERARFTPAIQTRDAALAALVARWDAREITAETFEREVRRTKLAAIDTIVGKGNVLHYAPSGPANARARIYERTGTFGLHGRGFFDTLACAGAFGDLAASKGIRYRSVI